VKVLDELASVVRRRCGSSSSPSRTAGVDHRPGSQLRGPLDVLQEAEASTHFTNITIKGARSGRTGP